MPIAVLALVGPTAAGKSALALDLAGRLGAEIVSIDSAAVYRGMDIGTDKPSAEDLARVRHHLVDVLEPSETLSVAQFQQMARSAIEEIAERGLMALLVGGSGLYFRAVVDPLQFPSRDAQLRADLEFEAEDLGPEALHERLSDLDPEAASRIQPANVRRTVRALEVIALTGRPFSSFRTGWDEYRSIYELRVAGLTQPIEELGRKIDERVDSYRMRGLVEEVKALEIAGLRKSSTSVQALGYAQVLDYLDGKVSLDDAIEEIKRRTRRFARRQLSWFRADPRVKWFESDPERAIQFLMGA